MVFGKPWFLGLKVVKLSNSLQSSVRIQGGNINFFLKIRKNHGACASLHARYEVPQSKLWPGGLSTDSDTNENNDANDEDKTRRTIHNCIGSLAFMPEEPKTVEHNHTT